MKTCPDCNGDGVIDKGEQCSTCGGSGFVPDDEDDNGDGVIEKGIDDEQQGPMCGDSGFVPDDDDDDPPYY